MRAGPPELGGAIQGALGEVNGLAATVAFVCPVELVGKYLLCRAALRAFTLKGFKVFERLETWAMLRS
jgi:hypothetical protein